MANIERAVRLIHPRKILYILVIFVQATSMKLSTNENLKNELFMNLHFLNYSMYVCIIRIVRSYYVCSYNELLNMQYAYK